MKLKKLAVMLIAVTLLFGCSTSKPAVYEGMNAEETYTSAIDKMNSEVSYAKTINKNIGGQYINEMYKVDGKIKFVYQNDQKDFYFCGLEDGNKVFHANYDFDEKVMSSIGYEREIEERTDMFNNIFKNDSIEMIETNREDKDGKVIITSKYIFNANQYDDKGNIVDGQFDPYYIILTDTINEDGYITLEVTEYYNDKEFLTKQENNTQNTEFVDFNKKQLNDFDKAREIIENCDGKTLEEFKASIQ